MLIMSHYYYKRNSVINVILPVVRFPLTQNVNNRLQQPLPPALRFETEKNVPSSGEGDTDRLQRP